MLGIDEPTKEPALLSHLFHICQGLVVAFTWQRIQAGGDHLVEQVIFALPIRGVWISWCYFRAGENLRGAMRDNT